MGRPVIETLSPGRPRLESTRFLPPVLSPLIAAAERGESLIGAVEAIVRVLGFDSMMYGTSLRTRPENEETGYVFTTLPREWVMRYDQNSYVEVDPRIRHIYDSAMPLIWDQKSERGKDAATDAFLDDAAAFGVCSGVAVAVFSAWGGHVIVAYNSRRPEIDEVRGYAISRSLPELSLLAVYFHELFMRTVIKPGVPSVLHGVPLSAREKKCLQFSAHGLTSREIAGELHISERMVELHFSHLRTKLGAANRHEAIAKAFDAGIIRRGELPAVEHARSGGESRRQLRPIA
jgi:DNA-binding CsgD family transcriptional regulator